MRRAPLLFALLLPACKDKDTDTGPAPFGPHAISFDDGPSCAAARVPPGGLPDTFTFEAWVKADPGVDYEGHPFIVWEGAAALWQTADGFMVMTDASGELAGAAYPADVMDQEVHHVAGTWDGEVMTVYVDGVRGAFSSAGAPGTTVGSTLYVGCWPDQEWHHQGLLDEIRISSSVRYADNYEVPTSAFLEDADTLYLWHADEGYGDSTEDAAGNAQLDLTEVGWVSWSPFDE
jgi:hypothetical protein